MALLFSILEASARRSVERGCTRAAGAPAARRCPRPRAMSLRSTRPPGPVPWTPARSMPRWAASLRATGEAVHTWLGPARRIPPRHGRGRRGRRRDAPFPARGQLRGGCGFQFPDQGALRVRAGGLLPAPPARVTARVRPTWMISPSLTPKLTSVPSRGEGMSATTLSVSTTARVWPCFTRWPGRTFNSSTLPSASPSPMSGKANSKRFSGLIAQDPLGLGHDLLGRGSGSGAPRGPGGRRCPARSGGRGAPAGTRRPPPRPRR